MVFCLLIIWDGFVLYFVKVGWLFCEGIVVEVVEFVLIFLLFCIKLILKFKFFGIVELL